MFRCRRPGPTVDPTMQIEFEAPPGAQVVEGSMTTPAHSAALAGRLSHLVQALKDDPGKM